MTNEQRKLQIANKNYECTNIGTLISKRVSRKCTVEYWYSDILTCIKPDAQWDKIKAHFLPLEGLLYPYHSEYLLILKGLIEQKSYRISSSSYVREPEILWDGNFKPSIQLVKREDDIGWYYTNEYQPEMLSFYDKLYGKELVAQMGGYPFVAERFMEELGLHGDVCLCTVTIKPDMIDQEELKLLPTAFE